MHSDTQNSLCKAILSDRVVTFKLKASLVKPHSAEDPSPGQSTVIRKDMRMDITACTCIYLSDVFHQLIRFNTIFSLFSGPSATLFPLIR